ncbi:MULTISPECIES: rod shape-determining protein RodA [Stenotrophomonas]|uniref:Peptidoglycan glycosyltransferase MrdB n=1 Tax=Stenotrophomonas nitritireducens TaxID=83617 RepID=A0ABR5NHF4_9GAMM|nr:MULTISPECIES: rod shape-determining protein RodA [Stenotrophomonas]KQN95813.1 rod shape-determining protein RodA [Stenotrophomonas sp. Leaf70]KRG55615.1 rod shape-determining protein RodA [Stenotrophomonas nitritireducens]
MPIFPWMGRTCREAVRTLDLPLLSALLAVMAAGLAVLHSVGGPVRSQAMHFAAGLGAMWLLSRVSMPRLRAWTPWLYAVSMLPLLAVYAIGTGKYGRRWLNLGLFYLQPSELLKLGVPLMIAWYLHRHPLPPSPRTVAVSALLIGVPALLILLQPNLGTATLVTASGVFALLLAGLHWGWIGTGLGALAVAAPLAWFGLLRQYQKDRVLTFIDPAADALGTGWNILQSRIAIGSGGWQGRGWGQGTQASLDFLPEYTTDFAFSVLAEEFGWLGVLALLLAYLFLVGRCLWIAAQARDTHARLLAGSLGLAFFVYVMVNGGMISGLLPVVGVPMPLISYGGTAAVSVLAGFGLVMAVRVHRPVHAG